MFYQPKMISGINDGIAVAKDQPKQLHLPLQNLKNRPSAVHKTLIPVDGSQGADRAIAYIVRAARRAATSEVHLINVLPAVFPGDFAWDDVVEDERQAQLAHGESVLDHAQSC